MKTVYVLFETDEWHTEDSQSILGVFSSKENAVKAAQKLNDPDVFEFTQIDWDNLLQFGQTQSNNACQFIIEPQIIDEIINEEG